MSLFTYMIVFMILGGMGYFIYTLYTITPEEKDYSTASEEDSS